ncbi:unnamed protein product [Hermetia illucens]|uniref:Uncharacterized protein n=1 Tax=Hermetia illucens TaxID=343691 RepID=A0A7R8YSN1_HERIL|nr:unnamed protein product [Hermetia illucens]
MWYEKDFHHHRRNFLSGEGRSDSTNRLVVAREDESDVPKNPARAIRSFLKKYLLQSSLHGARYVVEDELKLFERLIWACIMILSICVVTYINILLANRFNSSPLQTVIENVRYPVENILFPAVTICPEARVDWSRLEEAKEKFIPNATEDVQVLFGNFVRIQDRTIENIYYDDPKYSVAKNETFQAFNSLNIREVFESVKNPCENILKDECWWGHKRFRCCDIFVPQKSELGFCYAFNSLVNDLGLTKWDENEPEWPARTAKYGPGSGLRIRHVGLEMTIIIHHPYSWPINGFFFDSDTSSQIALKPRVSYVTPSTSRYDPVSRGCILPVSFP